MLPSAAGWQLAEPHALELPLVVGEEALLLRVIDAGVGDEAEGRLLAGDLHLGARERRLEPVGDAEIVGAEGDRVAAGAGEAQVVVPVDEARGGLADRRRDDRVGAGPLHAGDLRRRSQPDAVDVQRERRPLQQRLAVEEDVVREVWRGVDRHRDAAIRRDEPLDARLRRRRWRRRRCGAVATGRQPEKNRGGREHRAPAVTSRSRRRSGGCPSSRDPRPRRRGRWSPSA